MELLHQKQIDLSQSLLFLGAPKASSFDRAEALPFLEGTLSAVRRRLPGYLRHLFLQIHRVRFTLFRDNLEIMYKHLKQEKNLLQEKLNENKFILADLNR